MGAEIFNGRFTVENREEDEFVVFLIGMRINKWWALHKWVPVFLAMPPMIKELFSNKGLGFLAMENFFNLRSTLMVQYWESEDDLMKYAKGEKHLKAWREFNKKASNTDAVGIYHETYLIKPNQYESIYGNMPRFGLAKALGHKPVTQSSKTARQRLGKIK
ncbi:DUF4188 domain-containing protein [Thalassobacillus pellis]|uniref:DUF4188 domain-containing protein n=1 Tax=Thalassobacillus pellis TaxID=748008 RepID=UPI001961F239|nr:DUF4188 domain-containing protein [Thalassobacillus pellis]